MIEARAGAELFDWRDRVAELLKLQGFHKEADRWSKCHKDSVRLHCDCCGLEVVLPYRCELRICEHCAARQRARLFRQYRSLGYFVKLRGGHRFRLLTLTLPYDQNNPIADLDQRVDRLLKYARQLFRAVWGRRNDFNGAIGCIEINTISGYVHLHCLIYGYWVNQKVLSCFWKAITNESEIVYIQAVKGKVADAIREIIKYISKVPRGRSPEMTVAIFKALRGRRRVFTLGSFYNFCKDPGTPADLKSCVRCGSRLTWEVESGGWLLWRWNYDARHNLSLWFDSS